MGTFTGTADTLIPKPYPDASNPITVPPHPSIQHAFQWRDGVMTDLGALPGGSSQTTWISQNGLIVGSSENGVLDPLSGYVEADAVLWMKGQIIKLGSLGGTFSLAVAVNNRAQAVGFAQNAISDPFSMLGLGTQTRAFRWEHGVMQDLGTPGGPDSMAFFVNERGQVAGQTFTNSTPNPKTGVPTMDPFLWIPCDRDDGESRDGISEQGSGRKLQG
jgi:probable HAF family extracellular repeat protein